MESQQPQVSKISKPKYKSKEAKNVYSLSQITKSITLPIGAIGKELHQTIERTVAAMVEGKCIVEGFVKTESVRVITYSSGLVKSDSVTFNVVFECSVCFPVAGMLLNCVAKNITKAGIRAESSEETPSPFVLFIARDHYYASDYFNSIEEKEKFTARVIAQRFELNDKYVSIIAELVPQKEYVPKKPRLNLGAEV
jgi:DNA-directed RNA polymerase subunit E'/Rpb7